MVQLKSKKTASSLPANKLQEEKITVIKRTPTKDVAKTKHIWNKKNTCKYTTPQTVCNMPEYHSQV